MIKTIWIVGLFVVVGCASKSQQMKLDQMINEQQELKSQIRDVTSKLMVMQDRFETLKLAFDRKETVVEVVQKPLKPVLPTKKINDQIQVSEFLGMGESQLSNVQKLKFTNQDLPVKKTVKDLKETKAMPSPQMLQAKSNPQEVRDSNEDMDASKQYSHTYQLYLQGHFEKSEQGFKDFIQKYPDHTYTDNAYFWIANGFDKKSDCKNANAYYDKLIINFPNGNKVPEALLQAAICHLKLSEKEMAQKKILQLESQFPESLASQKAKEIFGQGSKRS